MNQLNPLPLEDASIYDVLSEAVKALGGTKVVGPLLFPHKPEKEAGTYCADCLNANRREKFSLSEVLVILRRARNAGHHGAMAHLAQAAGYAPPAPLSTTDELALLQREFVGEVRRLSELAARLERSAAPLPSLRSVG